MHVEKKDLEAFQKNELGSDEYLDVLEHIKSCDYCAEKLVYLEEEPMKAPLYLKGQILERTQMLDVQATVQIKKTSKSIQLLLYSLKTVTAVAGALLILFTVSRIDTDITFEKINIAGKITNKLVEGSNQALNFINEFSNQIVNGGMKK